MNRQKLAESLTGGGGGGGGIRSGICGIWLWGTGGQNHTNICVHTLLLCCCSMLTYTECVYIWPFIITHLHCEGQLECIMYVVHSM